MKANSETKQSKKATRRVLAGVLCGASVLSLVLSLVMPPISQAIANDAEAGAAEETVAAADSSTESTDVENTNNGDTENQNSDETEGDETGDDALRTTPLSDDAGAKSAEQPAEDDTNDEDAIAPATENESDYEIRNAAELSSKLLNRELRDGDGVATFKLMADIVYNDEIRLEQSSDNPINITLDLNGHKIKHDSGTSPLFDVADYATLTVVDSGKVPENVADGQQLQDKDEHLTPDNYGKTAIMSYDVNEVPEDLIYYVTESTASGVDTTEKIKEHKATIKGAIVGAAENSTMRLINVYRHGTFNLVSGAITQKKGCNVGNLIYAENSSTVNMSGGYVCGASTKTGANGAGVMVSNANGNGSTLNLIGGVIAGNCASSGGGVYAKGSVVKVTGGIISGNSTLNQGLGGGIMAEGGIVTVSGGYITNNRMAKFCGEDGNGCHGGAGLAANSGAHVTISGGQITGNYSEEAGGGVYVNNLKQGGMAWLDIKGGYIASNVSYRSEGAGIRVGQRVDAMINGTPDSKVYITNNHCMSRFDWGGGGIFVQGCNETPSDAGRLFVYSSYISSNTAGGYGGGVAVCPTGKTLVTNTKGAAIFGNSSAGAEYDIEGHKNKPYKKDNNSGNDVTPHLSGGGHDKNQDKDAYNSEVFRENGHADFFLAAKAGHTDPIAAVIGKMLGGGDAKYWGSKERSDNKEPSDNNELYEAINIPANGGVKIYRSVGLSSGVTAGSDEANKAQEAAGTFITGNYSWDHGGGIMSNGDLYLGEPADTYVYPSLKLKATKALNGRDLKDGEFSFTVYRKGSDDPFANGTFNRDACTKVGTANNDAYGNITFNLGEQFAASGTADTIAYYLAENAGKVSDITYDPAVYEIKVTVKDNTTVLMHVPTREDPNKTMELKIHNYEIKNVSAVEHPKGETYSQNVVVKQDTTEGYYSIVGPDEGKTFTNVYTSYDSNGSWVPKATKVVEGGEMKEFTLQLATDDSFQDIIREAKTTGDKKKQTLSFLDGSDKGIVYSLSDITKDPDVKGDPTGRGASKTFTYYVREKQPTMPFANYKYDESVYRFDVTMTDQKDKNIKATQVTYTKIKDVDGNRIDDPKPIVFDSNNPNEDGPTFTNTYSTSLPLSGMSGVTLTYLAGAAVLCAAAAWIHIRRKANAKGGERRE